MTEKLIKFRKRLCPIRAVKITQAMLTEPGEWPDDLYSYIARNEASTKDLPCVLLPGLFPDETWKFEIKLKEQYGGTKDYVVGDYIGFDSSGDIKGWWAREMNSDYEEIL